ncbi:MAG TPA: KH domain-containing protein [Candidatus Babeliales bacterium]|nr:KH domain-containing protein [Candidatus Babeliales bacterium]
MVKELVEYIVKSLVDGPDAVRVACEQRDAGYCVTISVLDQDRGRVIGRNGETIRAIRALASVVVPKDSDVTIEIAE